LPLPQGRGKVGPENTKGHKFKIGDKVEASATYEYKEDWRDDVGSVTGIWLEKRGVINVEVNLDGYRYDGFEESDLDQVQSKAKGATT